MLCCCLCFIQRRVCLQLTVTGEESADYKLVPLSGDQYSSCLCGGERKTVSWNLVASTTGEGRAPPFSGSAQSRRERAPSSIGRRGGGVRHGGGCGVRGLLQQ